MDGIKSSYLSEIFTDEPPPLDVFLYDTKYLNGLSENYPTPSEPGSFRLSEIQYDFVKNFERIWAPELYIAMVEEFGPYWTPEPTKNMFPACWGKGSGKDTTVRIGFTRIASLLSFMVSPQKYYGMPSSDAIQMLNVAMSAQQARDAFFDPMKRMFVSTKHLRELFHGDDPAEGSNRLKLKKNISIISGHSNAETQEGLNLIAGVADEISAFRTQDEFKETGGSRTLKGAEKIVATLRSSASSRFPGKYKLAMISWPRYGGDAIERYIKQGKEDIREKGYEDSIWYVSGPHPTWEVHPLKKREDFQEHFDDNYEEASAMYACKPPRTTNTFIRSEIAIDEAFSTVHPDPVIVDYYWGLPPEGDLILDGGGVLQPKESWQVRFTFSDNLKPAPGALYCLHGDLAIKGDRAGIAMSHVQGYLEGKDNGDERPIVKNDFVFAFESDMQEDPPREVQIRWYRQLIWELVERGFEIASATFDQFQSMDMSQVLNQYGIESGLLSLDRNDKVYQFYKDIILDGRLSGYRTEEGLDDLWIEETKKLRRVGKKVDHLPAFSKDTSDALAGSIFGAVQVGGGESDGSVDDALYGEGNGFDVISMAMHQEYGSRPVSGMGLFGSGDMDSSPLSGGYFRR